MCILLIMICGFLDGDWCWCWLLRIEGGGYNMFNVDNSDNEVVFRVYLGVCTFCPVKSVHGAA
jgi:hypothetical protein